MIHGRQDIICVHSFPMCFQVTGVELRAYIVCVGDVVRRTTLVSSVETRRSGKLLTAAAAVEFD